MSTQEHKKAAPKTVNCKVITVSDTRNKETDKSGKLMMDLLEQAGHKIIDYVIVKDEAAVRTFFEQAREAKGNLNP